MSRRLISSGSRFESLASYSRAVVEDGWVFVSGTIGTEPGSDRLPPSAQVQARNSLRIIESALIEAGSTLAEVVQCRVYVTDRAHLAEVIAVLAEQFRDIRPANTTVICQLPPPEAMVEIEVIARKRSSMPPSSGSGR